MILKVLFLTSILLILNGIRCDPKPSPEPPNKELLPPPPPEHNKHDNVGHGHRHRDGSGHHHRGKREDVYGPEGFYGMMDEDDNMEGRRRPPTGGGIPGFGKPPGIGGQPGGIFRPGGNRGPPQGGRI